LLTKGNPVLHAALAAARAEERALTVVQILRLRGQTPTAEQEARILATRDPAVLERWLALAVTEVDALSRELG
jgi:hypothetical protein